MFRALRVRSFRVYWVGNLVSQMGSWVQMVARPWLVYEITRSAAQLGFIAFLGSIPLLFLSLFGGVAADRSDRQRLIVITQSLYMALAFVLAGLVWTRTVQVWHVAVLSLLGGVVTAYDLPARQAMVTDMVGRDDLVNAIALNSASFNVARIVGPALAGFLVEWVGMGSCFFINGLSFLAVIIPLARLRFVQHPPQREGNVWANIHEGLDCIASQRGLVAVMSIVTVSSLFALPYFTLMPAFAKEVFNTNAAGMGALFSANGLGALVGALILARMGSEQTQPSVVVKAALGLGVALIAFALSRSFGAALVSLAFVGLCATMQNAITSTLVQIMVPDRLRGRVMSAYMMVFQGIAPFGSLQAGYAAEHYGSPAAVELGATISLGYAMAAGLKLRRAQTRESVLGDALRELESVPSGDA